MYVINEETKVVNIWADTSINRKRLASGKYGVVEYNGEVEQGYDGLVYARGHAPIKSDEILAEEKRAARDRLLEGSDKRMLPDFPISSEERELWLLYRKYLRDITDEAEFPHVDVLSFDNWLGQIHSKEPILRVE